MSQSPRVRIGCRVVARAACRELRGEKLLPAQGEYDYMDANTPETPHEPTGDESSAPRLRYDAPHPQPPSPMFARLGNEPPDVEKA